MKYGDLKPGYVYYSINNDCLIYVKYEFVTYPDNYRDLLIEVNDKIIRFRDNNDLEIDCICLGKF